MDKMNVLILGGTGAMGTHLVNLLEGVNCTVTTRRKQNKKNGVNYAIGNAHDLTFLLPLLNQCKWDAIVDFMLYTTEEFKERHDLYLNSAIQYVFLSSSRVYAESETPITEESPRLLDVCTDKDYLATDEYALAKARQEDILRRSGKYNWTIVRPYITFSETRLQLSPAEKEYWLHDALRGYPIIFSKDLTERFTTLTYGFDVARGIASLIGQDKAYQEAFHITTNEYHKWSEILETYLSVIEKKTGRKPSVTMLDKWDPILGGSATQVKWDRLYDRCFDNSKINRFIDTSSFKPTLPALADCLSEFIDHPHFLNINWGVEAMKDKQRGVWGNIFKIPGFKQKAKYSLIRLGLYH